MLTTPMPPSQTSQAVEGRAASHGSCLARRMLASSIGAGLLAPALASIGAYPANAKQAGDVAELVRGGLVIVANWEAKDGQADQVADILRRFLPQAQAEPGVKLFLISRRVENESQFLFYELFEDEAAYTAHQASAHFKTLIAGQALPLLAKRERSQYALL